MRVIAVVGGIFFLNFISAGDTIDCSVAIDPVNGACGATSPGLTRCAEGNCCSKWGYCGATADFCNADCQGGFGSCTFGASATCAATPATNSTIPVTNSTTTTNGTVTPIVIPRPSSSPLKIKTPLIAMYYPDWKNISKVQWKYGNIVNHFVAVTTPNNISFPGGDPTEFVRIARAKGSIPVMTVGGWTGSIYFSSLVNSSETRGAFLKTIVSNVDKYGFDGVEFDWEYPNSIGIGCNEKNALDSTRLLTFLQTLRTILGPNKLINMAVAGTGILGADGKPLKNYQAWGNVLNFLNLMIYDTYGNAWSDSTGPNAPLYSTCSSIKSSGSDAVAYFTKAGFPASKLLLGVPSYSYAFQTSVRSLNTTSFNNKRTKLYQSIIKGVIPQGDCFDTNSTSTDQCTGKNSTGFTGTWNYNSMVSCGILRADGNKGLNGYKRYYDSCSETPFLWNSEKSILIPYEDAQSISAKAEFVKSKGLAGLTVFDSNGFSSRVLEAARSSF